MVLYGLFILNAFAIAGLLLIVLRDEKNRRIKLTLKNEFNSSVSIEKEKKPFKKNPFA